ncbi:MAG TPA: Tol-Pal system beta propeller repeat protein TolB [Steroidobacteraceae bacterium]|jgi:TolB protein|nr:Tol-Pal system beta propeller repeat protein TolB [Steroidobacteraceae bacterium]
MIKELPLRARWYAVLLCFAVLPGLASAQLKIEITSGVTDPVPVAIVPFASTGGADNGVDVAEVIQSDLEGSGRFKAMARSAMTSTPSRAQDVQMATWKAAGNDYVVVGRVTALGGGQVAVDFELLNALTGQQLANPRFTGTAAAVRDAAHRCSDVIYEKILGIRGAFATRIAYVSVEGSPPAQRYQLVVADADGANARVILESHLPIMSPAWSPDGQWLAYVSFENKRSSIYVQQVSTGTRRLVSGRAGINGAPAWSPDGHKLLVTLGGSAGTPNLYVLDLGTQQLTRLTEGPSIDTEGVYAADGQSVYFTSDRSGGPQIYRIGLEPGAKPRRVSFESAYNARPRVSPDGTKLAMVTQDGANYRIAVQDLASGTERILSHGRLDASPSFAPNGAMIIFSGIEGGHSILQRVSVDGQTSQRLRADSADVREPVWAPFAH